ncbi:MAG: FAD:protein FMN transferase, partial [Rectinema sp.]|nr:FAD:protein FMN transferase [Rectinema sp.]
MDYRNRNMPRAGVRAGAALFSLVMLSAMAGLARPAAAEELSRTDFVIGTVCTVRLVEGGSADTLKEVFARLRLIEDRMSANKDGTEIALVNAQAGKAPVKVSPDTFFVISKALSYARLTDGEFDPSVGPLVKLWNIGSGDEKVPPQKQIEAARALIDWRQVVMDSA